MSPPQIMSLGVSIGDARNPALTPEIPAPSSGGSSNTSPGAICCALKQKPLPGTGVPQPETTPAWSSSKSSTTNAVEVAANVASSRKIVTPQLCVAHAEPRPPNRPPAAAQAGPAMS